MRELVLQSKHLNLPIQEFVPGREQDYLQLIAYEPSNTLKRIKQRAEAIKVADFEKLIAL